MSQSSPRLALPYLAPAQAQKHVTHNEALMRLDALVQLVLQDSAATTPPAEPALGAAYGLGTSPTGAWSGQAGHVAIWQGEGWLFLAPALGWRAYDAALGALRIWEGSAWVTPSQQDLLGIATSADDTNRLAVASAASLFSHAGAGHQLKINKSAAAETASLLFQSNWTGHAELGLAGSTDFSLKVSSGGSWQEAMVVKAGTARIGLGTDTPGARSSKWNAPPWMSRTASSVTTRFTHPTPVSGRVQAGSNFDSPSRFVCIMATMMRSALATRSMAPPMPLTIFPGIFQFAMSPFSETSIAPRIVKWTCPPLIIAKDSAELNNAEPGTIVIVCFPALIKSGST